MADLLARSVRGGIGDTGGVELPPSLFGSMQRRRGPLLRQRWWLRGHVLAPTRCWLSNRWHWRDKRRFRAWNAVMQPLTVPLADVTAPMSPATRRVAGLVDATGVSRVFDLGYGIGEAVAVAADLAPERILSLVDRLAGFDDDAIRGVPDTRDVHAAVHARNNLVEVCRDVLTAHPKPGRLPMPRTRRRRRHPPFR